MIELASAAGLGVALGIVTGMPLGVVNVAIVEAATRGRQRFAIGIGIGGALADSVHAAVGFAGVGRLVAEYPQWSQAMAIVSAVAIVAYAFVASRTRGEPKAPRRYGVVTGLLLTLPNPAALAAWIAVASALWPTIGIAAALVLGAGVGVGSALWFTLLAKWMAKLPPDHRATRIVPKVALVMLVGIAVAGVVRAFS